jgi:cell division protein FtsB
VLLSILIVRGVSILKNKQLEYESKNAFISDLQEAAESEENKAKQNTELDSQSITDEEYESLAREELGLIKKDEIVIKPR